jgi:nitric oxide reductase activation protein
MYLSTGYSDCNDRGFMLVLSDGSQNNLYESENYALTDSRKTTQE